MHVKVLLKQSAKWQVYTLLAFIATLSFFGVSAFDNYQPTVSSDKDDYAPGEVAIITGYGWTQDSLVDVHFEETPAYHEEHQHDYHGVKVNADGTWRIEYQIEERHFGVAFDVHVVGKQTGAEAFTHFTDAHTLTSLSPTSGSVNGGTTVTITGTGFVGIAGGTWMVKFGDAAAVAATRTPGNTELTVVTPVHVAGTVDVSVYPSNNAVDAKKLSQSFTYTCPTINHAFSSTNVSCNSGSDGSIIVNSPTGGMSPYQYSKDGGTTWQNSNTFSGLTANSYSLKIKDVNNCESAVTNVTIGEPAALTLAASTKEDASCFGASTGSVTAGAVDNAVGTVTYSWKNASNTVVGTTETVSNLPAGTYTVTVSDDCSSQSNSVTIGEPALIINLEISSPGTSQPVTTAPVSSSTTVSSSTYSVATQAGVDFIWYVTFNDNGIEKNYITPASDNQITINWPTTPSVFKVKVIASNGCATDSKQSELYVAVYDPSAGFVTGGGWIWSPKDALKQSFNGITPESLEGKANFGFVSKYKKGSTTVEGNTQFQFQAGNFNFKSSSHTDATLVISGTKATYRGEGFINGGIEMYKFMVSVVDGDSKSAVDKFRIKITTMAGVLVYDNLVIYDTNGQPISVDDNYDLDANNSTALGGTNGGGSIVIHEVKTVGGGSTPKKLTYGGPDSETSKDQLYNYPNTFSDRTTIAFRMHKSETYVLEVYDLRGVLIKKVDMGVAEAGKLYEYEFDGRNLAEGMYIARLMTSSGMQSVKMILRK